MRSFRDLSWWPVDAAAAQNEGKDEVEEASTGGMEEDGSEDQIATAEGLGEMDTQNRQGGLEEGNQEEIATASEMGGEVEEVGTDEGIQTEEEGKKAEELIVDAATGAKLSKVGLIIKMLPQ